MAEIFPKDRRGQMLLVLTAAAVFTFYVLLRGLPLGPIDGMAQYNLRRDSVQAKIDTLEDRVRVVKAAVRHGTTQQFAERLALYQSTLELMRQLVPSSGEVPNLLDDIASRARMRGVQCCQLRPQTEEADSGTSFNVYREGITVSGRFDQVSEFLTDIASLPRIVVPYDVHLVTITRPAADTSQRRALLTATFMIRTYVKSAPLPGAAPPPATAPAGAGASAEPRGE